MATLREVLAYFCHHYPHKGELSEVRLTGMVYLADWKSAVDRGRKLITSLRWLFDETGPSTPNIMKLIRRDPDFEIRLTGSRFEELTELIFYRGPAPILGRPDQDILDFVIDRSSSKTWTELTRLVYSTYPILTQPRHCPLDLESLAKKYRASSKLFEESEDVRTQAS